MIKSKSLLERREALLAGLVCLCVFALVSSAIGEQPENEKLFYAVEQNGVLCGFSEANISTDTINGKLVLKLDEHMETHVKALGATVDAHCRFYYDIDPETGMYFYHESSIDQGSLHLGGEMEVIDSVIRIFVQDEDETEEIPLPPGTLLEPTRIFLHLLRDFSNGTPAERDYRMFSEVNGAVHDITYTLKGIEEMELAGRSYGAFNFRKLDRSIGVKADMWIDTTSGYLLKAITPGRVMYLADSTITEVVGEGNLDENLFARTDVAIPDFKAISYMKVKAALEPGGAWITPASLNVPGQAFEGSVEENMIDGVFEISHQRYDGSNAPRFPQDLSGDSETAKYLEPGDLIESDEQVLIDKSREITDGATDSWDAVKRLSAWVSGNISYDIPGGNTALNTYNTRLGECGSHSNLLAAFCRAVGIPCRVVWGCMYAPNFGGAFCQHAWNEVYMGEAGWIPVDATAEEFDYVDCGHVRLGVREAMTVFLNPHKMEILDYKTTDGATGSTEQLAVADHSSYMGEYQGERGAVSVTEQNGSLAVVIPGRPVFEVNEPDENGDWFFKITNLASVSFDRDETGNVSEMTINSRQRFPRMTEDTAIDTTVAVPEEFRLYLGKYVIPMKGSNIEVVFSDSNLAIDNNKEKLMKLEGPDSERKWIGRVGAQVHMVVSFIQDDTGAVSAVMVEEIARFTKSAVLTGN
jgi:transglutaminase-like putative cysteine protease